MISELGNILLPPTPQPGGTVPEQQQRVAVWTRACEQAVRQIERWIKGAQGSIEEVSSGSIHGLPSGGTTAQVLSKSSNADWDVGWTSLPEVHSIPNGGTTGQMLTKIDNVDYHVQWSDVHDVPAAGTTGQVLMKTSNSDYAFAWQTLPAEADTLATVTGRGATTSTESTFSGGLIAKGEKVYDSTSLGVEILQNGNCTAVGTFSAVIDPTADTVRRSDYQSHGLNNGDRVHFSGSLPAAINSTTLYYVVNKTSGNFQVATTAGGTPIDFATAGSSVLFGAEWQPSNDVTFDLSGTHLDFVYAAGGATTVTQPLIYMQNLPSPNWYSFTYTVSNAAGSPSASITTAFAGSLTALDLTNGTHTTTFYSSATLANFVITTTLTAGQAFTLDSMSLKAFQGTTVVSGRVGVGVTEPLYPLDVAGVLNLRSAGAVQTGATSTAASYQLYTAKSPANPSVVDLFIAPAVSYGARLFFGNVGKTFYALNFQYVSSFETLPCYMTTPGSPDPTGSLSFYGGGGPGWILATSGSKADIELMAGTGQTFANAGFLTGGQNDTNVLCQVRWKSWVRDADTKTPTAAYSYDTKYSNTTLPHTLWQRAGSTLLTLGPQGGLLFPAGTATAGTAPIKLTSGTSLTAPEAGAIEFTTDDFFATITTGTARKAFVLDDGARLTSTRIPIATTNGRLTDSADLVYSSGLQAKMIYGSMYGDDINVTVTISVAGTYYEVGSGLSGGSCNQFTFQNAKELKCLVAGKYKVDWSMGVGIAGGANQHVEGAVMVNSTVQANTVCAGHTANASDDFCLGGTGIITLAVNDLVKLCVENETGTNNVTVDHANLSLLRVDS